MKKFGLLFILFNMLAHFICAEDKIYVDPDQVIFEKNGLFISVEGSILPINQLNHDEEGFYFCPEDINSIQSPKEWACLVCGHDNWFWKKRCAECNHRPQ
ncbi:putative uncharacterized protein [Parachlamydia acanthamoebae UV-7]|uniref:RanBP2-type domain-containing protein n=2 Tax=Parachlamydia acanthamoebae TaxID=83552 RepID=F8L1P1_PARAV|nr:hypothetical protein [Parachlamydia acanthamoebae]EFB40489.1 hypothetical protein pah_c200o038 [Parachlamydia acanthamoebae str. Hall's coccus]KIA77152.1 hypothetical protein DB43_GU00450 [Parachlamydia acanthamoebae]CCB87192.1 putative uncharacterized protein [Parachlamydia acanthamoebae UV-7]